MIVWIDTETTGLDYGKEALLEIAVVITDDDLGVIDLHQDLIKTPKRKLRRMGEYVTKMHTESGLLRELPSATKTQKQVEDNILALLDENGLDSGLILGGNSVHYDRRMLESRMPRLMSRFTHQNLDVSSIGLVVKRWMPKVYDHIKEIKVNDNPHRAMYDIMDSIEQLRHYQRLVFTTDAESLLARVLGEQ